MVDGIRANPAPQLLVCGSDDPLHDGDVAAGLADGGSTEVLELPGVDHALSAGDGVVAADVLTAMTDAAGAFLGRLP